MVAKFLAESCDNGQIFLLLRSLIVLLEFTESASETLLQCLLFLINNFRLLLRWLIFACVII